MAKSNNIKYRIIVKDYDGTSIPFDGIMYNESGNVKNSVSSDGWIQGTNDMNTFENYLKIPKRWARNGISSIHLDVSATATIKRTIKASCYRTI